MRLRKNMKRTAAAALALSMAVSAAAMPASAGYKVDMSQVKGDVTVKKETDNTVTVTVTTEDGTEYTYSEDDELDGVTYDKDDDSEVTITGDNRGQAVAGGETITESKREETTPVKQETNVRKNTVYTGRMVTSGTTVRVPGTVVGTHVVSGSVMGQSSIVRNNVVGRKSSDEDAVTYESEDKTPIERVAAAFKDAVNYVVKIINNSSENLDVTLDKATVDAGDRAENAMTISGDGDVTLNVKGENTLVGGSGDTHHGGNLSYITGDGINAEKMDDDAALTITGGGSLTAKGGDFTSAEKGNLTGGDGITTKNLHISGAEVTAEGGSTVNECPNDNFAKANGGAGTRVSGYLNLMDGAKLTAKGGDATSVIHDGRLNNTYGGVGVDTGSFYGESSTLVANGGNATAKNGSAYAGDGMDVGGLFETAGDEDAKMTIKVVGGNAVTESEQESAVGGAGLYTMGSDVTISSTDLEAAGGKAASKGEGSAGEGWYISNEMDATSYVLIENSKLTLTGGKAEGTGENSNVTSGCGVYGGDDGYENLEIDVEGGTFTAVAGSASGTGAVSATPVGGSADTTIWNFTDGAETKLEYKNNFGGKGDEDQTLTIGEDSTIDIILPDGKTLGDLNDADDPLDLGITIDGDSEGTVHIFEKDENGEPKLAGTVKGGTTYKFKEKKPATCTESGKLVFENVDDPDDTYTEDDASAPASGHDYEDEVVSPTCEKGGYTKHTCKQCDYSYESDKTDKLGHNMVLEKAEVAATCTSTGTTEKKKCSRPGCDYTEGGKEIGIDPTNHSNYGTHTVGEKAATCKEEGYTGDEVCNGCGEVVEQGHATEKNASNHSDYGTSLVNVKAATCKEEGYSGDEVCNGCGEVVKQGHATEKDASNHSDYGTSLVNVKAATCKEEGYTGDEVCNGCGTVLAEGETIEKAAHTPGDWEVKTAPTYLTEGEEVVYCTECGAELDSRPIPKLVDNSSDDNNADDVVIIDTAISVVGGSGTDILRDGAQVKLYQVGSVLYIEADTEETAAIGGTLSDLAQLMNNGIETIVFTTSQRTSTIHLAEVVALGSGETPFTLSHNGAAASLTVGGADHSELIH